MAIVTTVLICATVFGGIVAISAFIRQLIVSRERKLNDAAQQRALTKEFENLNDLRIRFESSQRNDTHYQVLEKNTDSIRYIDNQIEQIMERKIAIISRFSNIIMTQSDSIIKGQFSSENKHDCNVLRQEVDKELSHYNSEIERLQKTRANLWENHQELQDKLLAQESEHNKQLDDIYSKHSSIIEKLSLRSIDNSEVITKKTLDEGGNAFKMMILAPIKFLIAFFTKSEGIDLEKSLDEISEREDIKDAQDELDEWDDFEYDESDDNEVDETTDLKITA